jgi:hypothetical protein
MCIDGKAHQKHYFFFMCHNEILSWLCENSKIPPSLMWLKDRQIKEKMLGSTSYGTCVAASGDSLRVSLIQRVAGMCKSLRKHDNDSPSWRYGVTPRKRRGHNGVNHPCLWSSIATGGAGSHTSRNAKRRVELSEENLIRGVKPWEDDSPRCDVYERTAAPVDAKTRKSTVP